MNKIFLLFAGVGLFMTSCVSNPEGEKVETTDSIEVSQEVIGANYQLDAQESVLQWKGRKVSATHNGTVDFKSGSIQVDNNMITGGNFVVDMSTIVNEDQEGEWNDKLVGHLKSEDFFHIEEHPEVTFEITNVEAGDEEGKILVSGNLTIKGISKNITFNADLTEVSESKVQMLANFNIEREQWEINYTGMADDLIAKEINFDINIVGYN